MEYPTLIQIESSTACDAKCVFCPRPGLKRKKGMMSDELFEKILAQAGMTDIILFLNGEPLLFPKLYDWLQRLREKKLKTVIFTNGNDLNEDKAKRLISYSDVIHTIVFSIAGIDENTHQEIMGLKYSSVKENVERFCKMNNGQIKTVAHMPLFSKTKPFASKWTDTWNNIVGTASPTACFNFAGLIHDELEIKEDSQHKKGFCGRLHHLTILWDGRVCLCCMDAEGQVILGDVKSQSLLEIFNGKEMKQYRTLQFEERFDELKLCKDCNMNIYGT